MGTVCDWQSNSLFWTDDISSSVFQGSGYMQREFIYIDTECLSTTRYFSPQDLIKDYLSSIIFLFPSSEDTSRRSSSWNRVIVADEKNLKFCINSEWMGVESVIKIPFNSTASIHTITVSSCIQTFWLAAWLNFKNHKIYLERSDNNSLGYMHVTVACILHIWSKL